MLIDIEMISDKDNLKLFRFIKNHPEINFKVFFRQACLREIDRYETQEQIMNGNSQIDPALFRER